MSHLPQPPYATPLVQLAPPEQQGIFAPPPPSQPGVSIQPLLRVGVMTERWQAWFSLMRRFLRAELLTGTAEAAVSVADGANQLVNVPVTDVSQGDAAIASVDAVVPSGILLAAHASAGSVAVTIRNESGAAYAPGTVTVRATAWRE